MIEDRSIVDAMLEFYRQRSAANVAAFEDLISSEHVVFLGTAGHEWFEDRDRMKMAFGFEGVTFEPGPAPRAWSQGDIGWFMDTPTMAIVEGRIRVRTTLVVRREAGRWKIVHAHYSVGIPDELAAEVAPA
ncbi:MAG: nuclear transport factor 2 family protein [Chloroflexota bacterium]